MKRMKLSKRHFIILTALIAASLLTVFAVISVADNRLANDLLVTQSYVDGEIAKAKDDIKTDAYEAVKDAVEESLTDSYGDDMRRAIVDMVQNDSELRSALLKSVDSLNVGYTAILLKKGETLTGDCELIPRSGKVLTVCSGINGINDMTEGKDIGNGVVLPLNHYCAIPRDDGRSIVAQTDSYLLVRGNYRIVTQ